MNSWKIVLATMVIFVAGVFSGGLLVNHVDRVRMPRPLRSVVYPRPSQPTTPGGQRLELLRRMQRDLDLTPEQNQRVDAIITQSQERTKKIMEPVSPLLREEVARAKQEFRAVLTPEQLARFEALLRQQQRGRDMHHPNATRDHTNAPLTPSTPKSQAL